MKAEVSSGHCRLYWETLKAVMTHGKAPSGWSGQLPVMWWWPAFEVPAAARASEAEAWACGGASSVQMGRELSGPRLLKKLNSLPLPHPEIPHPWWKKAILQPFLLRFIQIFKCFKITFQIVWSLWAVTFMEWQWYSFCQVSRITVLEYTATM